MSHRYAASLFALIALSNCLAPSTSMAAGAGSFARGAGSSIHRIAEGQYSLAPFASVVFCLHNTGQCTDTGGSDIVTLTEDRREELLTVNSGINQAITPRSDSRNQDVWSVDVSSGDCEDFALTKRKHLLDLGWPSRALRIAVATTPSGEGHAVLVVRTSDGDLVLDNRTTQIRDWTRTDLHWIKMQTADPKIWKEINRPTNGALMVSEKRPAPRKPGLDNNDIANW
jgi:predicted transglutaminase-like cysteine proteinase